MEVPLIGRDVDLAWAGDVLSRPDALLLVVGDAGIGKSRLVTELGRRAGAAGYAVAMGRCLPLAAELPLLPVVELLRTLTIPGPSGAPLEPALSGQPDYVVSEVHRLLSYEAADDGGPDGWARERLLSAVALALEAVAEQEGLLLVVEDVHWVDALSRDCLGFLLSHPRPTGPQVVVTSRESEEADDASRWREHLATLPGAATLVLEPLDADAGAALATAVAGRTLDDDVVRNVLRRAEGNPFFIEQLTMSQLRAPALPAQPPADLSAALRRRASAVSATARVVLDVLSLAGRGLGEQALAQLAHAEPKVVRDAVRELRLALLVRPDPDGVAVRHALLAEVVADAMLPGDRADLHAELAARIDLEGRPDRAGEAAAHWGSAGSRPAEELAATRRAADYADSVSAYEAAATLWERAGALVLEAGEPSRATVEALTRASESWYRAGASGRAHGAVSQALALVNEDTPTATRGALLLAVGANLPQGPGDPAVRAAIGDAVTLLREDGPSSDLGRALLLQQRGAVHRGDAGSGRRELREALAVAEEIGDPTLAAQALAFLAYEHYRDGDAEAGQEAIAQARHLAADGSAGAVAFAAAAITESDLRLKTNDLAWFADQGLRDLVQLRQRPAGRQVDAIAVGNVARALVEAGDVSAAAEVLARARSAHPLSPDAFELLQEQCLVDVAYGRLEQAQECVRQVPDELWWNSLPNAIESVVPRAELALWSGAEAGTRSLLLDLLERAVDTDVAGSCAEVAVLAMRATAEVAGAPDRRRPGHRPPSDLVAEVDDVVERLGGDLFVVTAINVVGPAHGLSLLAERSRALGAPDPLAWSGAAAAWATLGRPHRTAYAKWRQAEALLERRARRDEVAVPLRVAVTQAVTHAPLLAAVRALAAAARIELDEGATEPEKSPTGGPDELTTRERQVLDLVAQGFTNVQIARRLYMSPKTVSVHVTSILRKLGASNRSHAAWIARQRGLARVD